MCTRPFYCCGPWAPFYGYSQHQNWNDPWLGVAFVVVIFGSVVLHVLGDALTATFVGLLTHSALAR